MHGIACPTHRGEQANLACITCLGWARPPLVNDACHSAARCTLRSLRFVLASCCHYFGTPSTLSVRPAQACSLVSYPCVITGIHACSCDNAHAYMHPQRWPNSSQLGANLDCITCPGCPGSSSALQRRLLLAAHSTRGSERFFELLTSSCRCVDTLVDALKATQCLQHGQPSNLAR